MKTLNKTATRILDRLTEGLGADGGQSSRKLDNAPGVYMAACVEKIGPARYSVAHYFEQNGDLVADPDLEIIRMGGEWVPVAITQAFGGYRVAVECDDNGAPARWFPKTQADLTSFANLMLRNVGEQQGVK